MQASGVRGPWTRLSHSDRAADEGGTHSRAVRVPFNQDHQQEPHVRKEVCAFARRTGGPGDPPKAPRQHLGGTAQFLAAEYRGYRWAAGPGTILRAGARGELLEERGFPSAAALPPRVRVLEGGS